jgi:hypothetical protein
MSPVESSAITLFNTFEAMIQEADVEPVACESAEGAAVGDGTPVVAFLIVNVEELFFQ